MMQVDTEEIKTLLESFSKKAHPLLEDYFHQQIAKQSVFLTEFEKHFDKLNESLNSEQDAVGYSGSIKNFQKELLGLILKSRAELENEALQNIVPKLELLADELLVNFPETIFISEKIELYAIRKEEKAALRLKKMILNRGISTRLGVKKLKFKLRRIFRLKPVEPVIYRKRKIPFRLMANHFMVNQFAMNILDYYASLMKTSSDILLKIWRANDKLEVAFQSMAYKTIEPQEMTEHAIESFGELHTLISQLAGNNGKEIEMITLKTFRELEIAYHTVDKADLPVSAFSMSKLKKKKLSIEKTLTQNLKRWNNAHLTLFDDWAVDVEITLLHFSVYDEFNRMTAVVDDYFTKKLKPSFDAISGFIQRSREIIFQSGNSLKKVRDALVSERKRVHDELVDTTIARNVEQLTGCFLDDIGNLMATTLSFVSEVSDKRAFVRSRKYDRPVSSSELSWISPRELLKFEALPHFSVTLEKVKSATEVYLEKARMNLLLLGTVADFSLESALLMLEQKKGAPSEAVQVAQEGFDRAVKHLETVEKIIQQARTAMADQIKEAVATFNEEIQKLKNTENIFDLNVKIARIRAIEKSKQMRKETMMRFRQFLPIALGKIKELDSFTRQKINEYSIRLGFTSVRKFSTFELSEFISHTSQALDKLPFVYQRLYQLSPTDEERFFVNRQNEIGQLTQSLENWKKNRFITTAVIGVKGSGITSLINFFLRGVSDDSAIIRHTISEKVYRQEHYFKLFDQILEHENFISNQEIIDFLNNSYGNRIIVIENLQHLYLKHIGGFDCLNMFFDLMANTTKKVLWIGAFTSYSWNYLNKTIKIADFFTDEIFLDPMSKETIEEIVFKRNRLSGYQIVFEPAAQNLESKSFRQMNEDDQQVFLRKQYFDNLHRMTNGNISLAQLYWLRSTLSVNEQIITIGALTDIDFSFIKSLSDSDLFVLQSLVLHDGLNIEDFALVMEKTHAASRNLLIPMLEKGLLFRPRNKFNIHPILFKPVTDYLSSRNFIH